MASKVRRLSKDITALDTETPAIPAVAGKDVDPAGAAKTASIKSRRRRGECQKVSCQLAELRSGLAFSCRAPLDWCVCTPLNGAPLVYATPLYSAP